MKNFEFYLTCVFYFLGNFLEIQLDFKINFYSHRLLSKIAQDRGLLNTTFWRG